MKKCISMFLAVFLLLSCISAGNFKVAASAKKGETRAIAIVFDNSGSMYVNGNQAWCRATYAMEVFASMLNAGDTLMIYPMHPITVGGKEYKMESPLRITDSAQAATIRDIHTPDASGTPIESIDCAVQGLQAAQASKKYMIVLTDGEAFYRNDSEMSAAETRKQLDSRFQAQAGPNMTVMYLGIGNKVVMPGTEQSEYFVKKQAKNSADVLSALTDMCNRIFGRDTLPKNHISGKNMDFDISMGKLIVFVQGENVSNLQVQGASGAIGEQIGSASTKFGTAGAGNYKSDPDKTLQGMMVTYANCPAGSYTIDYTGTATSCEVYYEPDADLDFVFTDSAGNTVDPNALYEGEYKVSFGMKDAKTGQLIDSDLLGKPKYRGSYYINGEEHPIEYDGGSGSVPVTLNMNDAFDSKLTVTYLSGYTITKDSRDFGWPEGGINVAARPAGELNLEISGGEEMYSLQDIEEGTPYIAKIFYQGAQLSGEELEKVKLEWEPETSNAEIKKNFADDHYELSLHYKNPDAPQDTVCGACSVTIYAVYAAKGSSEAQAQAPLTYNIEDDFSPVRMEVIAPQTYFVIDKLGESKPITVMLTMDGAKLTPEDFAAVELKVDCDGIEHTVTANEQDSCYQIKLEPTSGIAEGDYDITVSSSYTDHIGRMTEADESLTVTLSNVALWLKWLIGILILLLVIFVIYRILHTRVLPKKVKPKKDECGMRMMGKDINEGTEFSAKLSGKQLSAKAQYGGNSAGITIGNLQPGKESYRYKPSHKRSMITDPKNVKMFGDITRADINGATFKVDKEGNFVPEDPDMKTFTITNNSTIAFDGLMEDNGRSKRYSAEIPLTFKK